MRPSGLMVAALLAAAVISACSASPAINTGPLGSAGDGFFSQCSPASPGQTVTMGIWWLHNDGTSPVTVQSVHLGGRNLRITRPWLLPIYHNLSNGQFDAVGVSLSYPPTTGRGIPASAALSIWDERQPADGGVIRPGQTLNLVFGMTRTSATAGRAGGPVIVYSAGGTTYNLAEKTAETLVTNC